MAKMPNIARKFDSGVGFSNGCALLALKKPPPLVPNCLMISCEATGPCAMVCSFTTCVCGLPAASGAVTVCGSMTAALSYGRRFWTTPCDTSTSAPTMQIGSSTQSRPRTRSTQKLPMRVLLLLRDAANERDRDGDADRRRHEVVIGEAGHLREIAHGRLAAVGLPVRVGRERRGGVEREVRRHGAEALRVPRQPLLHALHQIEHQHRDHAEEQDADGVFGPAHLARLVDAGRSIDQPLDRAKHRIEPGALAVEDPRHEAPEHGRHRENREQEEADLKPAVESHVRTSQNFSGFSSATVR